MITPDLLKTGPEDPAQVEDLAQKLRDFADEDLQKAFSENLQFSVPKVDYQSRTDESDEHCDRKSLLKTLRSDLSASAHIVQERELE